jgi:hypothetical protein
LTSKQQALYRSSARKPKPLGKQTLFRLEQPFLSQASWQRPRNTNSAAAIKPMAQLQSFWSPPKFELWIGVLVTEARFGSKLHELAVTPIAPLNQTGRIL